MQSNQEYRNPIPYDETVDLTKLDDFPLTSNRQDNRFLLALATLVLLQLGLIAYIFLLPKTQADPAVNCTIQPECVAQRP